MLLLLVYYCYYKSTRDVCCDTPYYHRDINTCTHAGILTLFFYVITTPIETLVPAGKQCTEALLSHYHNSQTTAPIKAVQEAQRHGKSEVAKSGLRAGCCKTSNPYRYSQCWVTLLTSVSVQSHCHFGLDVTCACSDLAWSSLFKQVFVPPQQLPVKHFRS
jgi:hypothetical protein